MENKLKLILDNDVMVLIFGDSEVQIETNNGWFDLINNLCNEINTIYEASDSEIDIIPIQIKEKFGTLRFYYSYINYDKEMSNIHTKVDEAVRKYEKMSASICEICGKPGRLSLVDGYIKILCDEHASLIGAYHG